MTRNGNGIGYNTFWTVISMLLTTIGAIFFIMLAHADEPKHSESADEGDVTKLEVKVEGIAVDVVNNKGVLKEVKADIKELRVEQRAYTETILRAIREAR